MDIFLTSYNTSNLYAHKWNLLTISHCILNDDSFKCLGDEQAPGHSGVRAAEEMTWGQWQPPHFSCHGLHSLCSASSKKQSKASHTGSEGRWSQAQRHSSNTASSGSHLGWGTSKKIGWLSSRNALVFWVAMILSTLMCCRRGSQCPCLDHLDQRVVFLLWADDLFEKQGMLSSFPFQFWDLWINKTKIIYT